MRNFRSDKVTRGKTAAAARSLWQAGGMKPADFGKPIVAVANSFTEFVPGHVHLQEVGRLVCDAIWEAGGVPREFIPSLSTTASPWATTACFTAFPAGISSPTASSTWPTHIALMPSITARLRKEPS